MQNRIVAMVIIVVAHSTMGCATGMTPYQQNAVNTGATAGAVIGAVAGGLLGGDASWALIGGAAGASLGSVGGRIIGEAQEGFPTDQQIAQYQQVQVQRNYYVNQYGNVWQDTFWFVDDNIFRCYNPRGLMVLGGGEWCRFTFGEIQERIYRGNGGAWDYNHSRRWDDSGWRSRRWYGDDHRDRRRHRHRDRDRRYEDVRGPAQPAPAHRGWR